MKANTNSTNIFLKAQICHLDEDAAYFRIHVHMLSIPNIPEIPSDPIRMKSAMPYGNYIVKFFNHLARDTEERQISVSNFNVVTAKASFFWKHFLILDLLRD